MRAGAGRPTGLRLCCGEWVESTVWRTRIGYHSPGLLAWKLKVHVGKRGVGVGMRLRQVPREAPGEWLGAFGRRDSEEQMLVAAIASGR